MASIAAEPTTPNLLIRVVLNSLSWRRNSSSTPIICRDVFNSFEFRGLEWLRIEQVTRPTGVVLTKNAASMNSTHNFSAVVSWHGCASDKLSKAHRTSAPTGTRSCTVTSRWTWRRAPSPRIRIPWLLRWFHLSNCFNGFCSYDCNSILRLSNFFGGCLEGQCVVLFFPVLGLFVCPVFGLWIVSP